MSRLLHLSDLHAVAPGGRVSGRLDTCALIARGIDRALACSAAIGPLDAVIVTGDISDDGSSESYAAARAELDRLGLPLLAVPGNHDSREAFRDAFADLKWMPASGPIDWVQDIAGTRIIGLDTLVEGQGGGRLGAEGLACLAAALDGAAGRPVLVALHHPPLRTGIRFMDEIGLSNPKDLEVRLAAHPGPLRVLAGHVHGVYQGMLGVHPVSVAPSLCSAIAFDRRADAPVGFLTGPTGFAVVESGSHGIWTALPTMPGDGPFAF